MFEDVFDLHRAIVRDLRELGVQRSHQLHRVARAVQEIRVAEGDVPCPARDQAADVLQHDLARDHEEASAIHRGNRTMQAHVQATPARLDRRRRHEHAPAREPRVAGQVRQARAARHREREPLQRRPCLDRGVLAGLEPSYQADEGLLELAAQHRIGAVREEIGRVEQGVQAVEHDAASGIEPSDPVRRLAPPQPQRGVHRDADRDDLRALDLVLVERLDRQVERVGRISRPLEKRLRPGQPQRLVAQLVAGDEEDRSLAPPARRDRSVRSRGSHDGRGQPQGPRDVSSAKRSRNAEASRPTAIQTAQRCSVAMPRSPTARPLPPSQALAAKQLSGGRWGRRMPCRYFFRNAWSAARKSGVVRLTAFTSAPNAIPSSKRSPSS